MKSRKEPSEFDIKMMERCFQLAKNGMGNVAPNPLVGSVITLDNKIIGEGYHQKYGEAHAEVNAINAVKNKELLKQATLYVNLEPCAHYGKTPPCADLIIEHKIPRVVIGNVDPYAKVAGKGIENLENAGIEVQYNVLKDKGDKLNKRFFTYHRKKRPYIILKWAESADGFIDIIRTEKDTLKPTWLTNQTAKHLVHKWRSEEQAILVGRKTAHLDNPELNVREWIGNNPLRILIDRKLCIPATYNIYKGPSKSLIFNNKKSASEANVEFIKIKSPDQIIEQIIHELYNREIQSIIIEGGAKVLNLFITKNLWDEEKRFVGEIHLRSGVKAPKTIGQPRNIIKFENNILYEYENKSF